MHPILLISLLIVSSLAHSATTDELPRTAGTITVDGVLDEAIWADALRVELNYETDPGENLPAKIQTTAFLIEDGENLLVGFDARDPDVDRIRAFLRDRDSAWDDDFVGINLDTFGDGRRAFEFYINPLGVQADVTLDDTIGNEDPSWDAIWESAGQINADGYVVEIRIPLNQLRFQSVDGKQTWGYNLVRWYPRERRYRLSNDPRDRNINCVLCQISRMQGFEGSRPGRNLEIVPTLTASEYESTDDPGILPLTSAGTDTEAGISVRWGVTPDVSANLAINPDFSQVEADAAQLDINNRFALFFPEKRPFFLEGADYFSTPMQAVFTRTVSDPTVGLKLTGKRGANTLATFAADDDVTSLLFPGALSSDTTTLSQSNKSFVGRYSRGFSGASSLGGLLTVRDGDDYKNVVGGFDTRWRFNDQHSVRAQLLHSETEYPLATAVEFEQPLGEFSGDAVFAKYEYDSRNWNFNLEHLQLDEGFRADSGFVGQVGFDEQEISLVRLWFGGEQDWWTRIRLRSEYETSHDASGQLLEEQVVVQLGVGGPRQSWIRATYRGGREFDDGTLFNYDKFGVFAEVKPWAGFHVSGFLQYGDQIDFDNSRLGDQWLFKPSVNWNVSQNLLLRVNSTFANLETKQGEQIFDAAVIDARVTWQFNLRSFLRLSVQHQDIERNPAVYVDAIDAEDREVGRQLLYSYKLNPQTVFFLGYSDNHVDDDALAKLTVSDRSWFMKIGYAWSL